MGVLGVDVGGSGVKGAVVDTDTGTLLSERIRIATPKPSTSEKIAGVVQELVGRLDSGGPVGCSFPTVVVDGQALTAGNIDESWRGTRVDELFAGATGRDFVVHNDADVAGGAELALGAGRGLSGSALNGFVRLPTSSSAVAPARSSRSSPTNSTSTPRSESPSS